MTVDVTGAGAAGQEVGPQLAGEPGTVIVVGVGTAGQEVGPHDAGLPGTVTVDTEQVF